MSAPTSLTRHLDDDAHTLVFGRERTGLSNEELMLCHAAVHIPSVEDFSSLNLAAAVQVLAWELRREALAQVQEDAPAPGPVPDEPPASAAQMLQ